MTYKRNDMLTVLVWVVLGAALIVLGVFLRRPDFGERVWWVIIGVGAALVVTGLVSVGFTAKQAVELGCPHCGGRVVPRVTSGTSHLYLSKAEEAVSSVEEKTEEDLASAEEEAKNPEQ